MNETSVEVLREKKQMGQEGDSETKQTGDIRMIEDCRMGTILQFENKFLGVWQKSSKLFGFPKGCRIGEETDAECAQRELQEETGIVMPLTEYHNPYKVIIIEAEKNHYRCTFFWIKLAIKPHIVIEKNHDEVSGYNWLSLKQWWNKRKNHKVGNVMVKIVKEVQNVINLTKQDSLTKQINLTKQDIENNTHHSNQTTQQLNQSDTDITLEETFSNNFPVVSNTE